MKVETKRPSYWNEQYKNSISQIKDSRLQTVYIGLWSELGQKNDFIYQITPKNRTSMFKFSNIISNNSLSDISWSLLCDIVSDDIALGPTCCRFLYKLLENNLYKGEYAKDLYKRKQLFFLGKNHNRRTFLNLFIYDNIQYLYYDDNTTRRKYTIIQSSGILRQLLIEFYEKDKNNSKLNTRDFYAHFSDSLGLFVNTINGVSDFNYNTYTNQTDYFIGGKNAKNNLHALNRFYIFLSDHPSSQGTNIFKQTDNIDITILKRDDFVKRTIDGFKVYYYNPFASIPPNDKWILHINGFEKASSKMYAATTVVFDLTKVVSLFYRNLVKRYIWLESGNNFNSKHETYYNLIVILNYITELKQSENYPNPDLNYMSIHEATIIRNHIANYELSTYTKNAKLSAIRRFLKVQETNQTLTFDVLFFNYLIEFKRTNSNNAKAILDKDLIKINAVMKKYADESYINSLHYAIFHLCLQTEFRISQICHLKVDNLANTMKNNQYMITTVSKTSNGQEYTAVISNLTKVHLDDVLKQTEVLREECTDDSVRDYLFLHKTQQNRYSPVDARKFRTFLAKCCDEAGTIIYNANNLRDTHMTKAEEYRMRHGKSDAVLSVLSGHKRIDTTHNHYIETELTKMLEATYGIIIGEVDLSGKIVSNIDNSFANTDHEVENGCGYCKRDSCGIFSTISCLLCEDFITTIKHEKQFTETIIRIDDMIKNALTPHDMDDLLNIKRLYGAYLLEIWKEKGASVNE